MLHDTETQLATGCNYGVSMRFVRGFGSWPASLPLHICSRDRQMCSGEVPTVPAAATASTV